MIYIATPLSFDSIKISPDRVLCKEQKEVFRANEVGISNYPGRLFPGFEFTPMRAVWAVKETNEKEYEMGRKIKEPEVMESSTPSTTLTTIEKELAAEAAAISKRIGAPAKSLISTRDKLFTFPDGRVHQGPLDVVILDFVSRNLFYEGRWDPNKIEAPVCFAIGDSPSLLEPSAKSPKRQAEHCTGCPLNEFGSNGSGKACKNTRLLAVMLPDAQGEEAPIYTLSIPPTALKTFDSYVGGLSSMLSKAPIQVISRVSFHPEKTYALPIFGNPQPNERISEFYAHRADARKLLEREPLAVGE